MSWSSYLDDLTARYDALRLRQSEAAQKWLEHRDPLRRDDNSFTPDVGSVDPLVLRMCFDPARHFGVRGRTCIYSLSSLFSGLLYYDTLFVNVYPVAQEHFDRAHAFRRKDFERVGRLAQAGRVVLLLSAAPDYYKPLRYLEPLFRVTNPTHPPIRAISIRPHYSESEMEWMRVTDRATDRASVRKAIRGWANLWGEPFENIEADLIMTLQELGFRGHFQLRELLWRLVDEEPELAIDFAFSIRRLLINPSELFCNLPFALPYDTIEHDYRAIGRRFRLKNIAIPGEIGSVLANELRFPAPQSWSALTWCEDNLDVTGLRRACDVLQGAFGQTSAEVLSSDRQLSEMLAQHLRIQTDLVGRIRKEVYWGASLAIGGIGTYVGGPFAGLLAAAGFTTASNLLLEPIANATASLLTGPRFHLWRLKSSHGRREP